MPIILTTKRRSDPVGKSIKELASLCVDSVVRLSSVQHKLDALHGVELDVFDAFAMRRIEYYEFIRDLNIVDAAVIGYLNLPYGFICRGISYDCAHCFQAFDCSSYFAGISCKTVKNTPLSRFLHRLHVMVDASEEERKEIAAKIGG